MSLKRKHIAVSVVLVAALSACTPQPYVRLNPWTLKPQVTDAKARTIQTFDNSDEAHKNRRIICVEPSPDVAEAVSSALTASLQLELKDAKNNQGSLAGNLSHTTSESVAELGERLATIQLLRDKMYRACEAYGNGAIEQTAYALILARHDKTMMSLLSNELAAGAFGRALASIGASSTTSGPDQAKLSAQETLVDTQTKKVQTDLDTKADASADFKTLSDSLVKLMALESQTITSSTVAVPNTVEGTIAGKQLDPASIAAIHRNYIDDDGIDPLTDACIIGMESRENRLSPDELKAGREALASAAKLRMARVDAVAQEQKARNDALEQVTLFRETVNRLSLKKLRGVSPAEQKELDEAQTNTKFFQTVADNEVEKIKDSQLLLKNGDDPILDLLTAEGSPFAAFCYKNVLTETSEYVGIRLKQKRELRAMDPTSNYVAEQRLALCTQVLDKPIDAAFNADLKQKAIAAQCTSPAQTPPAPAPSLTAPTSVKATSSGGTISVTFTPPKSANISGYTATASNVDADKGEAPLTGSGTSTSKAVTIAGCKDGETYEVELEVTDAAKAKASAKAALPVICKAAAAASKPAAPSIKSASSNANTISITFDAPADGGSPISGYTATATNTNAQKGEKVLTGKSADAKTSIDIAKCSTDEQYTVTVTATNKIGTSGASKPSQAVKCLATSEKPPPVSSDLVPPTKLTVKSSASTLVVSFDAPVKPKNPATGYSASASNLTQTSEKPLEAKSKGIETGVVIPNCITGNSYAITAVAIYAAGKSDPATLDKPTTCSK